MKSKMFSFINQTWNPIGGRCLHNCYNGGCWATITAKTRLIHKYEGPVQLDNNQINMRFKKGDYVFVQDMSDLFGKWVPDDIILRVFQSISSSPDAKFLLLTKNPKRYINLLLGGKRMADAIPKNCVLGATIETDRAQPVPTGSVWTRAPFNLQRILAMCQIRALMNARCLNNGPFHELFISIEPICDFNPEEFLLALSLISPESIAIGYDNYKNKLPEPSLLKTTELIDALECNRLIKVYPKSLREPWNAQAVEVSN